MAWTPTSAQLPDLLAAFAEAERAVGEAFARAVGRHGYAGPPPESKPFQPATGDWWLAWQLDLPDRVAPFEMLKCDLDMSGGPVNVEASGWISVARSVGRRVLVDDDLWRSVDHPVGFPAAAAAAIRRVSAELVRQLGRLDLRLYLVSKSAVPGTFSGDDRSAT